MQTLSDSFIDSCRLEKGFRLRGENMTRIEVFVDAAFAFAVTMLVISIDQIPTNTMELVNAAKLIPAFAASVLQLMWIWHIHSQWSRRFGLEDIQTEILSVLLIILVLIYIYPLKIMFMGMFAWLTDGYLPTEFDLNSWDELRFMFLFYALGFVAIALLLVWMYRHALALAEPLRLSENEVHHTRTQVYLYQWLVVVGIVAAITPYLLKDSWVPFAGFCYALIGVGYPLIEHHRARKR